MMQNKFRYRVFDNDDKKTHDVIFLNYENNSVEWYNDKNKKRAAFIEEVPTVQCTGLKDKYGKLIYEKDIVRDISTQAVYKVSHKKCAFYLENKKYVGYFHELSQCFSISRLEVIGNIYENPELLKEVEQCQ